MDSLVYFKQVANDWDNLRTDFFTEEVREKAYMIADVKAGNLAADIGAGTGFITEGLLHKGLSVIAVDRSEEMLEQMRLKFNSNRLELMIGEAEKLTINNNVVDYAMANMYLHHVEEPLIAIKEMARILKPGGKLVLTDLDEHQYDFLKSEHHDRWMGFNRKDIKNWFLEAGLKNIEVDCAGGNCCTTSTSSGTSATISIFVAYGEK
jgi:ubiquinone/menaquinone biosynthesis C-methylase UbiE